VAVAPVADVALHGRLLAGDPAATSDLATAYLDSLAAWLIANNPRAHPHDCQTAAADALLSVMKNPASYKPELRSLLGYLRMAATGDLRNLLKSASRHAWRSLSFEAVELSGEAGKLIQEDSDPADIVAHREGETPSVIGLPALPEALQVGLTQKEQLVRQLMWRGERSTAVYAEVLQIADRPVDEQRREVKRMKDRLKKRLQRAGVDDG
jgi:DNA-directed RNA polymerase specialized sigma24 family protein